MPVLPVEAYTTQEWFDKEQELIFSKTWQFAGFVEDVKDPGDYVTVQAGLNNILVVRGRDQRLRAFHNLCRHRGTQLLRAVGKTQKAITCPYHDWTYSLQGDLISIPAKEREFPDLDMSQFCLHKASVETWRGMLWVHPDPQAESLMTWFDGIFDYLGPHQPEKLVEYDGTREKHQIQANWKIVVENYIDGYHLAHLHAETLYMYDHARIEAGFVGPHFMFYEPLTDAYLDEVEKKAPFPLIDHVPKEKVGAYVPMLFPNLGLSETESSWSIFHVMPVAPDRTIVEIRSKLMPMSGWDYMKQGLSSYLHFNWKSGAKYNNDAPDDPMASGDFMAEDMYACEQQQKSLKSPLFSVGATAREGEASVRTYQSIIEQYVVGTNDG